MSWSELEQQSLTLRAEKLGQEDIPSGGQTQVVLGHSSVQMLLSLRGPKA
jgi:hypothetical protein